MNRIRFIRWVGLLLSLAMLVGLTVAENPAHADTTGTPPNLVDYNRVPAEYQEAVVAFEGQAAREVLANHSLPESDFNAVRGWARNEVRAQMWANLVAMMAKDPASLTADEQKVYAWFQGIVRERNIAVAEASINEYLRYSGYALDNYTQNGADPLNYNHIDKNQATGGYCVYRAPEPYAAEYTGYNDQSCFTPSTNSLNFLAPAPTYEQFVKYGQYQVDKPKTATAEFALTASEVGASLATGTALAAAGIAVPIAATLGGSIWPAFLAPFLETVFPFALRGGVVALSVAAGSVAAIVGTVILFVVVTVLASIQIDERVQLPIKLQTLLDSARNNPVFLHNQVIDDQTRANDTTKSEDERKPKFIPGHYAAFLGATLPEADAEPCSGGLVISGDEYAPGCINSPAPAAIVASDPMFSVTDEGSTESILQRTIAVLDPQSGEYLTRASGNGWFVHQRPNMGIAPTQSLELNYRDWAGEPWRAERIYDEPNGNRFVVVPLGEDVSPADGLVTDTINLTKSDGTHASVRLVPSPTPTVTVTGPTGRVEGGQYVTFSASADPGDLGLVFNWYFPPQGCTSGGGVIICGPYTMFRDPDTDAEAVKTLKTGPEQSYAFATSGTHEVLLHTSGPSGFSEWRRLTVFVDVDPPKQPQTVTIEPLVDLPAGQAQFLHATSSEGLPVRYFVEDPEQCFIEAPFGGDATVVAWRTGTCTVTAEQPGTPTVDPASASASFTVSVGGQSIFFADLADRHIGQRQQVVANAYSQLPVTLSVDPSATGVCSLSDTTALFVDPTPPVITANAAGTCIVTATQAGEDGYWNPAVPVTRTFRVLKADQTIAVAPLNRLRYGMSQRVEATASSGLPVFLSVHPSSASICSLSGTVVTAIGIGNCLVTAMQAGDAEHEAATAVTRSFAVDRASNEISLLLSPLPPGGLGVGETTVATATSTALLPVTVTVDASAAGVCSLSGATVTATALGTCSLTATQEGNENTFAATPVQRSFEVVRAANTITFSALAGIKFGASQPVVASASSGLALSVAVDQSASGVCSLAGTTITAIGIGTCSLTATQAGNTQFTAAAPVTRTFTVSPAELTITARNRTIVYGQTPAPFGYDNSRPTVAVTGVACSAPTSPGVGTHPITCSGGNAGPNYAISYVTGTLTVTPAPAKVTVSPPTVQYSDPAPNLEVVGSVSGLVGSDVLAGSLTGCAASGLTAVAGKVTSPAGTYPLTGCAGLTNPNYTVSYQGALTVQPEDADLTYTGGWYFTTGTASTTSVPVSATVSQAADGSAGDLTKARVDFLVFKSTNFGATPDYSVTGVMVNSSGIATATLAGLPADTYHLVTRLAAGNGYFRALLSEEELTVYTPVPGASASGGGHVPDTDTARGKGHLGFSVSYSKQTSPRGQATYSWRNRSNGFDYIVRSNSWSGGSLVFDRTKVTLVAKANLTVIDPATGLVVPSLSGGNYEIKVVAVDNGNGGTTDTYAVTIKNPSGATVHAVSAVNLTGGNITVHS